MLAHALGMACYKDGFHTEMFEDDCKFKLPEPFPELQTYVAALTGGPVGPGDSIGNTNKDLIMKTCMPDGLLLKPEVPIMPLDANFYTKAFDDESSGVTGWVWRAYTTHNRLEYYNIFATGLSLDYPLYANDLYPYVKQSKKR